MKNQSAREARETTNQFSPKLVKPESHVDKLKQIQEAIARRAYELFESRGCEHGHDFGDWLRAETEILRPVPIKISEAEDKLTLQAEMPGFKPEEIEVSAEPRRLIIIGTTSQSAQQETENVFSREILTEDFIRSIDLPVEIDPSKVRATFDDGTLNVALPKVASNPTNAHATAV